MRHAALCLILCLLGLGWTQCAQELSYDQDGLNWGGTCVTSQQQSPVNLVASQFTPSSVPSAASMTFGTGTNVSVRVHFLNFRTRAICPTSCYN